MSKGDWLHGGSESPNGQNRQADGVWVRFVAAPLAVQCRCLVPDAVDKGRVWQILKIDLDVGQRAGQGGLRQRLRYGQVGSHLRVSDGLECFHEARHFPCPLGHARGYVGRALQSFGDCAVSRPSLRIHRTPQAPDHFERFGLHRKRKNCGRPYLQSTARSTSLIVGRPSNPMAISSSLRRISTTRCTPRSPATANPYR